MSNSYVREGSSSNPILSNSKLRIHMVKNIYTPGGTVEIQTQTHWKLIGCSINASQHVLSLSSILPSPLSYWAFIPARKNCAPVKKNLLFFLKNIIFKNCVILKLLNLKLCKSGSVYAKFQWHCIKHFVSFILLIQIALLFRKFK